MLEKLKQANENLSKGKNLQLSVGIGSPYWWRNKTLSERPKLPFRKKNDFVLLSKQLLVNFTPEIYF